jgi:hypothetical protein
LLRPYDIESRNKIYEKNNYFNLQKELSKALSKADNDSLLNSEAKNLLIVIRSFGSISSSFSEEKPEVFNSSACDVSMGLKHYYDSEGLLLIVRSTPFLKEYINFCNWKSDFWRIRNDKMAENILNWCKVFKGKTIVVLCGFEHRYYLLDILKNKIKEESYLLKDFTSY